MTRKGFAAFLTLLTSTMRQHESSMGTTGGIDVAKEMNSTRDGIS
jgi:hypothetical protein